MKKEQKKKKSIGKKLSTLGLIIALGVFLYSAYQLFMIYSEYKQGTDEYDSLRQYVTEEPALAAKENAEGEEEAAAAVTPPDVDFASLQAINPDIIGWLHIEAIDISYPIVQGEDNDHYLHYTYEGRQNGAGAIFLNYTNSSDFSDPNSIIYGHNMKNGSMFGKLKKFQREDVYLVSPYFWICTPDGNYLYEIFSYHTTSATGSTYTLFSGPGAEFKAYIEEMKSSSEVANEVEVTENDKIVTLSTCTGNDAYRFVVQGKRLPEVY